MTSEELLKAWNKGDKQAGGAFVERYSESVLRFFRARVDKGVEDDRIQQTFAACAESASRFRIEAIPWRNLPAMQ
ncbi:MAG: hypothetical protein MJE77_35170 [Proteobacteria bacterium]|nr:hypothetical protein [Pseudomonadota bacterium]